MSTQTDKIREALEKIAYKADHQIPAYATEETQAGSYLASYLEEIRTEALAALAEMERQLSQIEDLEGMATQYMKDLAGFGDHIEMHSMMLTPAHVAAFARSLAPSPKVEGEHIEGADRIPIWLALHAVTCWWGGSPIRGGSMDLPSLEATLIDVARSAHPPDDHKPHCPRCMPPGDPNCPYCDGTYEINALTSTPEPDEH